MIKIKPFGSVDGIDVPLLVITDGNISVELIPYGAAIRSITVPAPNGGSNTVSVRPGAVCVSHASCPDQVCVRQGWVSYSVFPIVCLPNQLVIQIKGGESDLDAATG